MRVSLALLALALSACVTPVGMRGWWRPRRRLHAV